MNYPNLQQAAEIYNFRKQNPDEAEVDYRAAMANHVAAIDPTGAMEIKLNKPHDDFTDDELLTLLALQMQIVKNSR